jgi:serine/threonine protein kinase
MSDSAYESNFSASPEQVRTSKRQKRSTSIETHPKPYQCTFIDANRSYCLQSSKDSNDWKRHEETHYPQKRWVCLIQGSNENISCHVCSENIDPTKRPGTTAHEACLKEEYRPGHFFPRRDKLVAHVKYEHGFQGPGSIESWYQNLSVDWKTQCGFCGEHFSEWDQRCRHVGQHFLEGKRMVPDWKDPWPEGNEGSDQGPDDDQDKDEDNMGDRHADHGDETGKDNVPPKDNSGGNGWEDDQAHDPRRDDTEGTQEPSSQHGSKRSRSGRKRDSEHQGSNQQKSVAAGSIFSDKECQQSAEPSSRHRLDDAFRSVRKLGYGAFGIVEEIVHSISSKHFARKTIRINHRDSDSSIALAKVRKEVTALRQLTHEHIVKVLASYQTQAQFSMIMSPVADCNLSEFIRDANSRLATQRSHLSKWFGCLASALSYVHNKSWLHMDLKPQNILVSGDRVFLSDFGSAWPMAHYPTSKGGGIRYDVTPMYCAPELVGRDVFRAATWASDIYSLGCIYLEMATTIHRESISTFEDLRSFGRGDKSFHANAPKSRLWIERLLETSENTGLKVRKEDLLVIGSMLSIDVWKRPSARSLEKLYLEEFDCDEGHNVEDNYIVKADGKAFDPVAVASAWLKTCVGHHKHCSTPVMGFFPTRILNVGSEGEEIRLQSKRHESTSPYIALSHCWSRGNILRTTSETLEERCLGIKSSSLSDDFQKAVRLTQALGFNYLWIDSLCILQDSPEDWAEESSKMHEIFSNSYLTISILNEDQFPSTSSQGSVVRRLSEGHSKFPCPTCVHTCRAFKPLLEGSASTMLLDSPLSKRGWALQERLLSPRVLHYSSTRLAWECRSDTLTFDATSKIRNCMGAVKRSISSFVSDYNYFCRDTPQLQRAPKARKLWRDIVREYSKRQLSRSSDKLPALAGLAAIISAANGYQYLAGLWNDDLKHGLLWSRDDSEPPTTRPAYRAPSWSWAAIDSQVKWSKSILDLPEDSKTTILCCNTTLCSTLSPFGGVSDGYIKIRGPVRKAAVVYPYMEALLGTNSLEPFAFGQWDALESPVKMMYKKNELGCQISELWCLQVLNKVGLMLKKSWPHWEGRFERVGIYWIQVDGDNEESLEGSWEQHTVTLV